MVSLVCLPLCFVLRCRFRFYISLFIVDISRHSIIIVVSGYCVLSFFVSAFRTSLLNSIHDKIGNRSCACWFCLDFFHEIAVQTNRSKGVYKADRRKVVCRLFGRQNHMYMAPQLPPSFQFSFTLRPKNEKPLTVPPKNYRRIALPPNKYRHILVYRFRQSRYRRKMKNRLPPANYRRMAIPPRLCPPKKPLPTTTLKITSACSYEFQFIDVFLCKTIMTCRKRLLMACVCTIRRESTREEKSGPFIL